MKLLKKIICNIWDIFDLPKFSRPSEIKIPKCKIPEIVPTDEYKKRLEEYLKDINFENTEVYVNSNRKRWKNENN